MIGLILLIAGAIYLAILIFATRGAYRWAKGKGLSKAKCWLAAAGGFLVIYLPVFWDHIPTLIAHQYYCKTEAGFWVYKTPEQWKKENPGVAEALASPKSSLTWIDSEKKMRITYLNERFEGRRSFNHLQFIPITIFTDVTLDLKSGEVLVKHVSVGSGHGNMMVGSNWRSMKFWLKLGSCEGETLSLRSQYESIQRAFEIIGDKK